MSQAPRVIQFPHPGFEYRLRGDTDVMPWKQEGTEHNRKYLLTRGSLVDPHSWERTDDVSIGFWGEWEPPSRWTRSSGPIEPYHPTFFHEPLLPASRPDVSHQNTDPIVFGDAFIYSNCKQYLRAMRDMPPGSIVLFGRGMKVHGERRFVLDTCFVVESGTPTRVARYAVKPWGQSLLHDLVLGPFTPQDDHEWTLTEYRARMHASGGMPFSFVPAVAHDEQPEGFARPVIRPIGPLEGLITETLMMGLKPTTVEDADAARAVWDEVVRQVQDQGCMLGVHAQPPERGSVERAQQEARKAAPSPRQAKGTPTTSRDREGNAQTSEQPSSSPSGRSIPRGLRVGSKDELARVLREWLRTGEKTIGDGQQFKGRPWIHVDVGGVEVVLNADTKRDAVRAYLSHVTAAGPNTGWQVIPTGRGGRMTKVTFVPGGGATPGWYAYTSREVPPGTTL